MFYVSEMLNRRLKVLHPRSGKRFSNPSVLDIPFGRVKTDEAISMDACASISKLSGIDNGKNAAFVQSAGNGVF